MQYAEHRCTTELPLSEPDPDVDHHTYRSYDDSQNSVVSQFFTDGRAEVFLGYNVIVMLSEKIGHAAIGIECKENWLNEIKVDNIDTVLREYEGKNYLYCETTGDGYRIGHIKEDSSIQDFDTIVEIKA